VLARGDTRTAYELASDLNRRWRERFGDGHEHVWAIALYLGRALRAIGCWLPSWLPAISSASLMFG
jgi:hypothetical protein